MFIIKIASSNFFTCFSSLSTSSLPVDFAIPKIPYSSFPISVKSVMNLFVISKEKLKEIVESSGFSTKIEIVERTEELQLSSCREFFNDNNIAVVDITV